MIDLLKPKTTLNFYNIFALTAEVRTIAGQTTNMQQTAAIATTLSLPTSLGEMLLHAVSSYCLRAYRYYSYGYYYRSYQRICKGINLRNS